MIDKIVEEINEDLKNGAYLSALYLALTLPDICGKVAYPEYSKSDKKIKLRYERWFNEYIGKFETDKERSENPHLNGEIVYSLRNCAFHDEDPDVDKGKIDIFYLVKESLNEWGIYSDFSVKDGNKKIYICSIPRLCTLLTKTASIYYNKNKGKFPFKYHVCNEEDLKKLYLEKIYKN